MATYVLVHGAWHTGKELENVADYIRSEGHTVYLPTLIGNRPGDSKSTGLEEAIQSLVDFFIADDIRDAIVLGHSYGGMVITALADRL
ncbi:MAG: alpha/beta hydrolase, partial [Gammaproteobacteria bacterium]